MKIGERKPDVSKFKNGNFCLHIASELSPPTACLHQTLQLSFLLKGLLQMAHMCTVENSSQPQNVESKATRKHANTCIQMHSNK